MLSKESIDVYLDKYEVCSKYYSKSTQHYIARKTKRHTEPGYTRPLYCYKCKTITEFCEEL